MRIVNGRKFLRMVLLIIGMIIVIFFSFSNKSYSKGELKEKTIYIANGDTLWSIASEERENNDYYKERDIREIIHEIKRINNLDNNDLFVGQKLIINVL